MTSKRKIFILIFLTVCVRLATNQKYKMSEEFQSEIVNNETEEKYIKKKFEVINEPDTKWNWFLLGTLTMVSGILFSFFHTFTINRNVRENYIVRNIHEVSGIIMTVIFLLSGLIWSRLILKIKYQKSIMIGLIISCVSMSIGVTFLTIIPILTILVLGLGFGSGFGLVYLSSIMYIVKLFNKFRIPALCLFICGSNIWVIINHVVFRSLNSDILVVYCIIMAILILIGVAYEMFRMKFISVKPSPLEENFDVTDNSIFKNRNLIKFMILNSIITFGTYVTQSFQSECERHVFSSTLIISFIIGCIIFGGAVYKFNFNIMKININSIMFFGFGTLLFRGCRIMDSRFESTLFTSIAGLAYAGYVLSTITILINSFGAKKFPNTFAYLLTSKAIGVLLGYGLYAFTLWQPANDNAYGFGYNIPGLFIIICGLLMYFIPDLQNIEIKTNVITPI